MFLHSFNVYGVKELTVRSIQRAGSTQQCCMCELKQRTLSHGSVVCSRALRNCTLIILVMIVWWKTSLGYMRTRVEWAESEERNSILSRSRFFVMFIFYLPGVKGHLETIFRSCPKIYPSAHQVLFCCPQDNAKCLILSPGRIRPHVSQEFTQLWCV